MRKLLLVLVLLFIVHPAFADSFEGRFIGQVIGSIQSNPSKLFVGAYLDKYIKETPEYSTLKQKVPVLRYTITSKSNPILVCYDYCWGKNCGCLTQVNYSFDGVKLESREFIGLNPDKL